MLAGTFLSASCYRSTTPLQIIQFLMSSFSFILNISETFSDFLFTESNSRSFNRENHKLSDRILLAFHMKTCPFALSIGKTILTIYFNLLKTILFTETYVKYWSTIRHCTFWSPGVVTMECRGDSQIQLADFNHNTPLHGTHLTDTAVSSQLCKMQSGAETVYCD